MWTNIVVKVNLTQHILGNNLRIHGVIKTYFTQMSSWMNNAILQP